MKLTHDFSLDEFLSLGDTTPPSVEVIRNLRNIANRLQLFRDLIRRPIRITSGYRSIAYNAKIGGAPNSYHVLGMAADIVVDGMSPKDVQSYLKHWSGGLGSYDTFTHVDIREEKVRWFG